MNLPAPALSTAKDQQHVDEAAATAVQTYLRSHDLRGAARQAVVAAIEHLAPDPLAFLAAHFSCADVGTAHGMDDAAVHAYINSHALVAPLRDAFAAAIRARTGDPRAFLAAHFRDAAAAVPTKAPVVQLADLEEVQFANNVGNRPLTATLRLADGRLGWWVSQPGKQEQCMETNVRGLELSGTARGGQCLRIPGHARLKAVPEIVAPSGTELGAMLEQLLRLAIQGTVTLTGFENVAGHKTYEKARKSAEEKARRDADAKAEQAAAVARADFAAAAARAAEIPAAVEARMAAWRDAGAELSGDERKAAESAQLRRVEAEEIGTRDDWRELRKGYHQEVHLLKRGRPTGQTERMWVSMDGGGCAIPLTEQRGINLIQLRGVQTHITRRCVAEGWVDWQGAALVVEKVALYDCANHVILPFTVARECSFVEMVAHTAQPPKWFVSHWWGEPVVDFISCLEQHAQDYALNGRGKVVGGTTEETPYWVCAYANNQWALGDALTDNPGETSFHKAMALAEGTVSVLDKGGVVFTRIWCGYEVYVSLASTPKPKPAAEDDHRNGWKKGDLVPYKWVVYTALDGVSTRHGNPVPAVGIADGLAPCDNGSAVKQMRESFFPLTLADMALGIELQKANATVESDKVHILNAMIGERDFNAKLPTAHLMYNVLNETLRARFAAGSFRTAVLDARCPDSDTKYEAREPWEPTCKHCEQAPDRHTASSLLGCFCGALAKGRMRELSLNLLSCACFTPSVARQLGAALPRSVVRLELKFSDGDDVLLEALIEGLREQALPACEVLDLRSNKIGARGLEALAGALTRELTACRHLYLGDNQVGTLTALLGALSTGALAMCQHIDLSYNQLADDSFVAFADALSAGALPVCKTVWLNDNRASAQGIASVKSAAATRSIDCRTSVMQPPPNLSCRT